MGKHGARSPQEVEMNFVDSHDPDRAVQVIRAITKIGSASPSTLQAENGFPPLKALWRQDEKATLIIRKKWSSATTPPLPSCWTNGPPEAKNAGCPVPRCSY